MEFRVIMVDNMDMVTTEVVENPSQVSQEEKPESRSGYQQNWLAERRKYGKCQCGRKLHTDAKSGRIYNLCKTCLKRDRERKRKATGCRPRRGNGRGRPRAS